MAIRMARKSESMIYHSQPPTPAPRHPACHTLMRRRRRARHVRLVRAVLPNSRLGAGQVRKADEEGGRGAGRIRNAGENSGSGTGRMRKAGENGGSGTGRMRKNSVWRSRTALQRAFSLASTFLRP